MANAELTKAIDALEKSLSYFSSEEITAESPLPQNVIRILGDAFSYYNSYYKSFFPGRDTDYRIVDVYSFRKFITPSVEIEPLIAALRKKNEEQETSREAKEEKTTPTKEVSTIPADLETLVAQYKESQQEALESNNSADSVAEAVKRARKTWDEKNRIQTILKNRDARQQEIDQAQSDLFFTGKINPKAESKNAILYQASKLARQAVDIQANNLGLDLTAAQKNQAINEIIYLGLAGSLDITNPNNLNIATQLAFRDTGAYFDSPIFEIDDSVKKINKALEEDRYSLLPEQEEEKLKDLIGKNKSEIEAKLKETSENLLKTASKANPDFDLDVGNAKKAISDIQSKLSSAIPNARKLSEEKSPLEKHATELEIALRHTPGSTLNINTSGIAPRAEAALKTVQGQGRELTPEAMRLYNLGLTPEELERQKKFATDNPNSQIGKFYSKHPDVFKQVRFQLENIRNNPLGKELEAKTLSPLGQNIANAYNKLPAPLQGATKIILDPRGTVNSWVNKKVGEYIGNKLIKETNSALAKQLGSFILKEGFEGGVKKFVSSAATKIALDLAAKAGISITGETLAAGGLSGALAVALGIPTMGASLIIFAAGLILKASFDVMKNGINSIRHDMGIEGDFEWGDILKPGAAAAGGLVFAGATTVAGLYALNKATRLAAISGITIVIISSVIAGLYFTAANLVAPMLSTLVQLDSVEQVEYPIFASSSGDCKWPTTGHYIIPTGPNGGTHRLSKLEGIDISAPLGSSFLAVAPGTVVFTGPWGNYGNTAKIQSNTTAGSTVILYAHMTEIGVSVGDQVHAGSIVGLVGGTGGWDPHIHFHYEDIKYNSCPAGGLFVPDTCCNYCGDGSPFCTGATGFLFSN